LGLALLLMMNSAYAGNPIEGGTSEAMVKYKETLKSVVSLGLGTKYCTGTLVAKNIVLTAKHCTDQIFSTEITINDQKVKVEKILSPSSKQITAPNAVTQVTDIALILFNTVINDCEKSPLKMIPTISILKSTDKVEIQTEKLLSGYGVTHPESKATAGTLRAGENKIATADEIKEFTNGVPDALDLGDSIVMISQRKDSGTGTATPGDIFDIGKILAGADLITNKDSTANVLPGDSGGALIGFDSNDQAYVLGVTSMTASVPKTIDYQASVAGVEKSVVSGTIKYSELLGTGSLLPIIAKKMLKQSKHALIYQVEVPVLTDDREHLRYVRIPHNMQDFKLTITFNRTSLSIFDSVTTPVNADFIATSMTALEAMREELGTSICQ
jgi:hypothetical protein